MTQTGPLAASAGALLRAVPIGPAFDDRRAMPAHSMTRTTVNCATAPCGVGKTLKAASEMALRAGRYLYVIDRRDVAASRISLIEQFAAAYGTDPLIVPIYSRSPQHPEGSLGVRRAIREAGTGYGMLDHVVVVATAEAMQSSDLSTYVGWTAIIDEVPATWAHQTLKTRLSWGFFRDHYNLIPSAEHAGWSRVQAKADAPSAADYYADDLLGDLAAFHRRVRTGSVVANLTCWEDAASATGWQWFSAWNPLQLSSFRRVILLGNAAEQSTFVQVAQARHGDAIRFQTFALTSPLDYAPRTFRIEYFASEHTAGTHFWTKTAAGAKAIESVAAWLAANSPGSDEHYVSSNTYHQQAFRAVPGRHVSPRVCGENGLSSMHTGSFVYSAKIGPQEAAAFDLLGIPPEAVVRAREGEDLIQMAWRGSLRVAHDPRPFVFRVYDRVQAEFLRDYAHSLGLPIAVDLRHIDIGIDTIERPRRGPASKYASAEERAVAIRQQKRDSMRRKRAGNRTE